MFLGHSGWGRYFGEEGKSKHEVIDWRTLPESSSNGFHSKLFPLENSYGWGVRRAWRFLPFGRGLQKRKSQVGNGAGPRGEAT